MNGDVERYNFSGDERKYRRLKVKVRDDYEKDCSGTSYICVEEIV
jgi:hypothetical protein